MKGRERTRRYTRDFHRIGMAFMRAVIDSPDTETPKRFSFAGGVITATAEPDRLLVAINGAHTHIRIEHTPTGYGARRWMCCPYCAHRRNELFIVPAGAGAHANALACRCCLQLHYRCQSEDPLERQRRKIAVLRYRLINGDQTQGADNLFTPADALQKPTGKHRQRYARDYHRLMLAERRYYAALNSRIDDEITRQRRRKPLTIESDQMTDTAKPTTRTSTIDALAAAFPDAISLANPKPLALDVRRQLKAWLKEHPEHSPNLFRRTLSWYTQRLAYHRAVINGTHRYNIDGTEAEVITDAQREYSAQQRKRIKAKLKALHDAQKPAEGSAAA